MPHTNLLQLVRQAFAAHAPALTNYRVAADKRPTARSAGSMSRRGFVRRTLAASAFAAGSTLFAPPAWAAKSGQRARIAIVGAGLAGLTCAYRLKQAGYNAMLFEASSRVGGRCYTGRGLFADNQIIEHGGELIDQGHTEIRHLAQELGLPLDNLLQAESSGTEPGYYFDGGFYPYRDASRDIKQVWQTLHRDLSAASYPTLYNLSTPRGRELDQMSVFDWIEASVPGGNASRLGQLLNVAYVIEYGADAEEQSALNLIYLLGYSGQGQLRIFGPSNEKYHVRGGNDQIATRLAELVSGQIEIGAVLIAVELRSDGTYRLTLEREGGLQEVTVDKVVLALPFSILRYSVDYSGAGFRPLKVTAIERLGMGRNAKLQLQFQNRLWRDLGHNGDSFADTGYQSTWEVTRGQPGKSGILVDYTGGAVADAMNSTPVDQKAQEFLAGIEPLLPGLTAQWNGQTTLDDWPRYQWTRGSYAYWKVGQYTQIAGIEREQEGNCHFAGEHTSVDSQGYLNGAVESGERAAREILSDLTGK